jgi:hypothetical protein
MAQFLTHDFEGFLVVISSGKDLLQPRLGIGMPEAMSPS